MTFLGCTFSPEGTRPLEEKVVTVNRFQQPVLVKDLRHCLGMLNFYRRFMPQTASIQASLHAALVVSTVKGSQPVDWTSTIAQAFEDCKAIFSRATLLAHLDPSTTLALFTDASDIAISVALQQSACDVWQPLAFYTHKLSPAQQKYSPYDRELLTVYEAIKYFRHMVEGLPFVIFTDHKPLTYAFQKRRAKCSPR